MTQIEQQQARLRQIRTKNRMDSSLGAEVLAASGEAHHTIGIFQRVYHNSYKRTAATQQ